MGISKNMRNAGYTDRAWWYSTIPEYVDNKSKDEYSFDNPVVWDKLRKVFDEQK